MQMNDMILISIDDHIIEPADMFDRHMPAKYRDQAPRYLHDQTTGKGYWEFQGQQTGMSGLGAVASWPHEEWGMDPIGFPEMRPATYDIDLESGTWTRTDSWLGCASPPSPGSTGCRWLVPPWIVI